MSVRVDIGLQLAVSSSTSNAKDLGNLTFSERTTSWGEGGSRKLRIAAGATGIQVDLCDLADAQLLLLSVYPANANDNGESITIRLNDLAADEITIDPLGDKKRGFFLLTTSGLTTIYVNHPGTVDVELTLVAAGD